MIRFLFVLVSIFILILLHQKSLMYLRILRLKNKIKNNPLIGIKQKDDTYYYTEKGYTISYRVKESPAGIKIMGWLSLRRHLTFFEEKTLSIKRSLNKISLYQRWVILFRPSVAIILITSLIIFYLGIKENSLKRVERFRWVVSRITGIKPESIKYVEGGEFKIFGQKRSVDREVEPVVISFNPLRSLFFSDTANVSFPSRKLNTYISYSITINDKEDVWLGKGTNKIHGKALGDKIVWDEPQKAGIRSEVTGHHVTVEDGKLKIFDE